MSWQIAHTLLMGIAVGVTLLVDDPVQAQESLPAPKVRDRETKIKKDDIPPMRAHSGYHTVAFSPDGKRLAAGSRNSTLQVWDAVTGRPVQTFPGIRGDYIDAAYSPDGKWLAASHRDGAQVWEATTGKEAFAVRGVGPVARLAFTPDSRRLAAGGAHTISVWDVASGQEVAQHLGAHCKYTSCVAFSADGVFMASCSTDKTIKLWDLPNDRDHFVLAGHTGAVHTVAFSPDGKCLASASLDRTIKIWFTPRDAELLTLAGHAGGVHAVAYSPDGRHLASGSADRTVRVWDLRTGKTVLTLEGHTGPVYSVVFSPDGRRLASTGGDCVVKLWDLTLHQPDLLRLSPEELEASWCDLSGGDSAAAYLAGVSLSAVPGQTVALVKERVPPAEADPTDAGRLARLIADLDANQFDVREQSTNELERLGRSAEPALRRVLEGRPSLEVARRVEHLLERNSLLPPDPDQEFAERVADVLERIDSPGSRALLHRLARASPDAWLTVEAKAARKRMAQRNPAVGSPPRED